MKTVPTEKKVHPNNCDKKYKKTIKSETLFLRFCHWYFWIWITPCFILSKFINTQILTIFKTKLGDLLRHLYQSMKMRNQCSSKFISFIFYRTLSFGLILSLNFWQYLNSCPVRILGAKLMYSRKGCNRVVTILGIVTILP